MRGERRSGARCAPWAGAGRALGLAFVFACEFALGGPAAGDPVATPSPAASAVAPQTLAPLYAHGQVLVIAKGFLTFTSGTSLRIRPGTPVPPRTTTGSAVRVTVDQLGRDVIAIERDPRTTLEGEIDVAAIDRQYDARDRVSQGAPALVGAAAPPPPSELVGVSITVTVPANTPPGDDVYLSTDRSNFSPSEVRMQRIDGRRFNVTLSLPAGSRLRYDYTRGYNATVERDRNGDIAQPHDFLIAPGAKIEDAVARWADLT